MHRPCQQYEQTVLITDDEYLSIAFVPCISFFLFFVFVFIKSMKNLFPLCVVVVVVSFSNVQILQSNRKTEWNNWYDLITDDPIYY